MTDEFKIELAEEKDVPVILYLINKMAEYEKLSHEVTATEERLKENLFGEKKYAEVLLGYYIGNPVGYAVYFYNFSTFLGKPGIYLEDIFLLPETRGKGFGKAMFKHLVSTAKANDCERLDWCVLDWNKPAIDFYLALGAKPLDAWSMFRLDKQSLDKL